MMKFRVRAAVTAMMSILAIMSSAPSSRADNYPSRPITMVVGFAPGGFIDVIARMVGQRLSQRLGQTVIVENRPGAGGNLAHRRVAASEPDGYTIMAATTSIAINESLYPSRGYTADDFTAVSIAASTPEFIATGAQGAKTLAEFIEASRGTSAQFATAGAGSASYIVTEYFFQKLAKVPATHIPYQGGAPAISAAIGNQVPLVAGAMAGGLVAPVKDGVLRGLAVASDKRVAVLPNVPTYIECGYPGFTAYAWTGFFVPAKTPKAITDKLNAEIDQILQEPEIRAKLEPLGFEVMEGDQKTADQRFRAEISKWREMVEAIHLKIE